jgi:pimeloyl-ACP methyl ester carboxylesterase
MMHSVLFLPGIIAPAADRYAPLQRHLDHVNVVLKDLAIYRADAPPPGYSIGVEVDDVLRAANEAGLDRFHIYGHSGGGAVAIAFAVAHSERVVTLALDEPAHDFTDEGNAEFGWPEYDRVLHQPPSESIREFMKLQVQPGVALPPPPPGAQPSWMAKRPAGVRAFVAALRAHRVPEDDYRAFEKPVYFSWGSLTHPRWHAMAQRLSKLFPTFTAEQFEGLHHLNASHVAEPQRVAARLTELWQRESGHGLPN